MAIVFIGMETSGVLRRAFQARGFETYSADLLPSEDGGEELAWGADGLPKGRHMRGDVFDVLDHLRATDLWPELAIFHPDCTMHTVAGAWAFGDGPYHQHVRPGTLVGAARREKREQDEALVRKIAALAIRRKAIENPRGTLVSRGVLRKQSQTIHPNQFGHDASKATDLWLWNLPHLRPTAPIAPRIVNGRPRWANQTDSGQNRLSPGPDRWKERARTYQGIGDAMADQWGAILNEGA